jgi:hypothetical protein
VRIWRPATGWRIIDLVNLLLAAVDVAGPSRWRWELQDEATGEVIAEHHVSLDGTPDSDQVATFGEGRRQLRVLHGPLRCGAG